MFEADTMFGVKPVIPIGEALTKWGGGIDAGFQTIPDALIKNQHKLGMSPVELAVLLNLTMHWWYAERLPYPATSTIAKRIGKTSRTVQRALNKLNELGLIQRELIATDDGDRVAYDLAPLVEKLEKLARNDPYARKRSQGPRKAELEGSVA